MSDERLEAITIHKRVRLDEPIQLAPYDPHWSEMFLVLANRIRDLLGSNVLLLEHVGSTSIPGLSAKPVIDFVLEVPDSRDEASYVPALEDDGFVLRIREPGWFEHRLLKTPSMEGNLHVFSAGCDETGRMLLFRDWLRTHDDDRKLYEDTKRRLSAQVWAYTQDYADAKSEVVSEILARAEGR